MARRRPGKDEEASMKAPVLEQRPHDANPIAKMNRQTLADAGVIAISVSGGLGCGKTSLIEASIARLMPDVQVGVIACDIASHLDADRLARGSDQIVQVNTGLQGTADSMHIHDALQWLDLEQIEVLFIENVGTLVCPNPLELGQDLTTAVFSVAGGHDKANKHPQLVQSADVVVLNKTDLLHAVPFDLPAFRADVQRLNPNAKLFELSALTGEGVDSWVDWLREQIKTHHSNASNWFG
jgi:hydrogenase nickel incorporation protein HypB